MKEEANLRRAVVGVVAGEQDEVVPDLVDVFGRRHGAVVGRAEIEELLHFAEHFISEFGFPPFFHDHALLERWVVKVHHPREKRRVTCKALSLGQSNHTRHVGHVSPLEVEGLQLPRNYCSFFK